LSAEAVIDQAAIETVSDTLDEATLGKQLFEIAAACRAKGIDPESALRRYTQKVVDSLEEA
jgi:XTP/dITP diphosphohydrolase/tetrapyrrole methylase family protein/MazG family protein